MIKVQAVAGEGVTWYNDPGKVVCTPALVGKRFVLVPAYARKSPTTTSPAIAPCPGPRVQDLGIYLLPAKPTKKEMTASPESHYGTLGLYYT